MANEITIQASLALQRSNITLQASGTTKPTQTGSKGLMNIYQVSQVTGTTGTTITFPGLANLGYLFVQNQIGNASVQVALTNDFSVANNIFATLAAEEFCLIPMAKTSAPSLYVRPITATTPSIVVAATEI